MLPLPFAVAGVFALLLPFVFGQDCVGWCPSLGGAFHVCDSYVEDRGGASLPEAMYRHVAPKLRLGVCALRIVSPSTGLTVMD